MNVFEKVKFLVKKPKSVIVTGGSRKKAKEAISQVLNKHSKAGKEVFIFETDLKNIEEIDFLVKNSSLPILVATNVGDVPLDRDSFAGEKEKADEIKKLAKIFPVQGYVILNFDDEVLREIKSEITCNSITFGFQENADFLASDVKINGGTNFKVNYKGNSVPFWLEGVSGKEQVYAALSAAACGIILDLNLVEISQALKS